VYYTLQYSRNYDEYYGATWNTSQCGAPGMGYGLLTQFSETEFPVPYGKLVEIPIGFGTLNLCESYNDIELQIIATCEIPVAGSQVYQYGVDPMTGAVSYDPARRLYASNDTAKFSLSWKPPSSNRALRAVGDVGESELYQVKQETKQELESMKTELLESMGSNGKQEMESLKTELLESMGEVSAGPVGRLPSLHGADSPREESSGEEPSLSTRKSLWEHLHRESWLLDPAITSRTLKQLGVEAEDDLALLNNAQLEQLAELFKPIPKKKFLRAPF